MPTLATLGVTLASGAASAAINRPDDSAQKAQMAANQRAQAYIERAGAEAAQSGQRLFGAAQENIMRGNEAAMGLFGQFAPQQLAAFQQGNVNAQQQIAGGLPQIQAALMGTPVDYSAFQPRSVAPVDTRFMRQNMPGFRTTEEALAPQEGDVLTNEQASAAQATLPAPRGGSIKDLKRWRKETANAIAALSPEEARALVERGVLTGAPQLQGQKPTDTAADAQAALRRAAGRI